MRRKAKVDGNQAEIVTMIRANGWSVQKLTAVGDGCPDLLIGKGLVHALIEVKLPTEDLNARQELWHEAWQGTVYIVRSVDDARTLLSLLGSLLASLGTIRR